MIRKLKWKNHSILGNLELDFTRNDGSIYPTVLIVGENGSGKTTILDSLSEFLNLGAMTPFDFIEYDVDGTTFRIYYESDNEGQFGFHKRMSFSDDKIESIRRNKNNDRDGIDRDTKDIRNHGVIYSRARSGFKTNQIKTSSVQQIDNNKFFVDANDDYTSVKQLIVDLRSQDASKLMELMEKGENPDINAFKLSDSKLYRFTSAFDQFFENLRFKKVDNDSTEEKRVLFEKYNKEISVDDLSTGEKQIVFRGTQLLRNSKAVNNGIVLIDEPELSLHPIWQEKILDYYINLFEGYGNQLILSTHSEYVLKAALKRENEILVIVLQNENGIVTQKKIIAPIVLPSITFAEINNIAFNVYSSDYHIELYGYLQSKAGLDTIKETDDYIKSSCSFNRLIHTRNSSYTNPGTGHTCVYSTLPTYIRNAIDHPDNGNVYTDDDLKISTDLLIELCR